MFDGSAASSVPASVRYSPAVRPGFQTNALLLTTAPATVTKPGRDGTVMRSALSSGRSGKRIERGRLGRQLERDPAVRLDPAQAGELGLRRGIADRRAGRRAGRVVAPVRRVARGLHRRQRLQAGDRGLQVLALALARFLAAELEPVDIGLRREAAGAGEQALSVSPGISW